MVASDVTVIVCPWQQFSRTKASLDSIFAFTSQPFELIYVDGNSPPKVRRYLEQQARARNFTLIRRDRYLTSAEAHNLALRHVQTKYVAFVDNGVLVTPGWLEAMIRCEHETGAWAVGPTYCTGSLAKMITYSAGPELRITEEDGQRRLHETAPCVGKPLADVRDSLQRRPCGYVKSHCMLTTKDVLARLEAFDERYTSYQEHRDFCLQIQRAGGSLFFEPSAVAVILTPPPLAWSDLPLFLLRWSDAWLQPSIRHFALQWGLRTDDPMLLGGVRFRDGERRRLFRPVQGVAYRLLGPRGGRMADRCIDTLFNRIIEPVVIARLERRRVRDGAVHVPGGPATMTAQVPQDA